MEKLLVTASEGAVRTLVLNRPERLNALSFELLTALNSAFEDIERDDMVRAVLLTGAGRGLSLIHIWSGNSGPWNKGDKPWKSCW